MSLLLTLVNQILEKTLGKKTKNYEHNKYCLMQNTICQLNSEIFDDLGGQGKGDVF